MNHVNEALNEAIIVMGASDHEDLVGIYEIAEMAGVSRQAVANWRVRLSNFPEPVAELRAGPVFDRAKVRAWLNLRNGQSAPLELKVISTPDHVSADTMGAQMNKAVMSRHSKKILIAGGGLVIIAGAVLIAGNLWHSNGASIMGTVVPAERYRQSQVSGADVKLGDTSVAQAMQTDAFERMVKDPDYRKEVESASTNSVVNNATSSAVNSATNNAVKSATNNAVHNATNNAVNNATNNAVNNATNNAVNNATNNAVNNAVNH